MVKRTISLKEELFKLALEKARKYHAGNFSAYITFLISKDIEKIEENKSKVIAENILKKFEL